jgi:hypothetical protein
MHERPNVLINQVIVSPTPTALCTNVRKMELSLINMREPSEYDATLGLCSTDMPYEAVENRRMKGIKDSEGRAWSHSAPAVRGNRSRSRDLADCRLPIT